LRFLVLSRLTFGVAGLFFCLRCIAQIVSSRTRRTFLLFRKTIWSSTPAKRTLDAGTWQHHGYLFEHRHQYQRARFSKTYQSGRSRPSRRSNSTTRLALRRQLWMDARARCPLRAPLGSNGTARSTHDDVARPCKCKFATSALSSPPFPPIRRERVLVPHPPPSSNTPLGLTLWPSSQPRLTPGVLPRPFPALLP